MTNSTWTDIERTYTTPDTERSHKEKYPDHWERYEFAGSYALSRRVLDVACGCGYGTALLSKKSGIKALGLDLDGEAINWAKYHYGKFAEYIQVDQDEYWPLKNKKFDLVVSLETIEHVPNPKTFLNAIYNALQPNGILVLSTPCNETETRFKPTNPFHLREYTWDELGELVTEKFKIQSRWSQCSNSSLAWDNLKSTKTSSQTINMIKKIIPNLLLNGLKKIILTTKKSKEGVIQEGYVSGINVQIIVAEKL